METRRSRNLFHYTSSEGVIGILTSNSMFASHYGFLNDSSEGRSLRDFLQSHLEAETREFVPRLIDEGILKPELLTANGPGYYRAEVGRMFQAMDSATDSVAPYFVTSFCIHEENTEPYADGLLSQWRGYGRGGFAIEFDELKLDELASLERDRYCYQGILADAVHYRDYDSYVDLRDFDGFAATLFKEVFKQVLPVKARERVESILGEKSTDDFGQAYLSKVPFLKNAGFEEENEYRIAALCNRIGFKEEHDDRSHKTFCFRARSDGRITPYIKLFDELSEKLPIKSIIVGPHPHQDSQINALNIMLDQLGLDIDTRASRIPFREQ